MFHVMLVYQRVVIIPSTWNVVDPIDITSYTVLWGKKTRNKPAMTLQKNTYKNGEIGERFKHDCFTYPLVN